MTLRVLFCSDAPWSSSGYANQLRILAPRLAQHCDLALLATYGLHGAVREWEGLPVYPGGNDPFANDVIGMAARDWKADVVITLKDSFVFNPQAMQGVRWCPMCPVDHEPVPPMVANAARAAYRPIAYAKNGLKQLRKAGFDPLFASHAYDPGIYRPESKAEARKFLNLPDDLFIIGTVAVNRGGLPSRKAWSENIEAFGIFAKDKPNVRYFLHTYAGDDGFEASIPLRHDAAEHGVLDKILLCDQEIYKRGFDDGYMLAYYNAIDVLNAVSIGEGFGIPALEAQACGCPVITGDWAAQEDLCFGGWKVGRDEAYRFKDGQRSYVYLPDPDAVANRMLKAYHAKNREQLHDRALAGAAEYQIDMVVERDWTPLLAALEAQITAEAHRGVLRIVKPEEVLG